LLGFALLDAATGEPLGYIDMVLGVANNEVVFSAEGTADLDDPLLRALSSGTEAAESLLLRVQGLPGQRAYAWHFHVPLVAALVPVVSPLARVAHAVLPAGLLAAGELPHLLAWLRDELRPHLLTPRQGRLGGRAERMPSATVLQAAGRDDLVAAVRQAGGFAAVAAQLRLRGARKPVGYWDDIEMLGLELREFVDAAWTTHTDAGDEGALRYWYNDLSGDVRWQEPPAVRRQAAATQSYDPYWTGDSDSDEEEEETESEAEAEAYVLPTKQALVAAGRWDLAAAVAAAGGQRALAAELGWPLAPRWAGRHLRRLEALRQELLAFAEEGGNAGGTMPSFPQLRAAGRDDLAAALVKHGGRGLVAEKLGLRLMRSRRGRWASRDAAVTALRAYMHARDASPEAPPPPRATLVADGRGDLLYAISRHRLRAPLLRPRPRGPVTKACDRLEFDAAREVVRVLRLGSQTEWQQLCREGRRPVGLPANPAVAYAASWQGWPHFLGMPRLRRPRNGHVASTGPASLVAH